MPVVPGWHGPLPLSSGSLLGSADADFLFSTTCSENISAVQPGRGAIAAPEEEEEEPLHQRIAARMAPLRSLEQHLGFVDASLCLKKSDIFICACKEF